MRVEGVNATASVKRLDGVEKEIHNPEAMVVKQRNGNRHNETPKATEEDIIAAIESANKHFEIYDKRLEFSIHEKTKEILVKIIDSSTDEVIKEIPSEKILDMIANMMELAGLLVDERA